MKLTDRQELKTVAEVKAELLHHNECVDAWADAMEWLENAVKDKLNKKATKAILTKWQTEYTSGHRQEKDLGNGLGWEIYMRQSPYDNECNMIYLNACDVEYYSNGQKFLKPVRDFYTGQFEYPKGATWAEVLDAIHKYVLPQKYQIDDYYLERTHENLQNIIKEMRELEHYDNEHYKTAGYYLVSKFMRGE